MKKVLFLHYSLLMQGGIERALVNLLRTLPVDKYEITLQMLENGGHLFEQLPEHIEILPPLWQFGAYSEGRMTRLRECGMGHAAEVRESIRARNLDRIAGGGTDGEMHLENWRELRELCPDIPGEYDIAVAFSDSMALKICCEKVTARRKIGWVHTDYRYNHIPAGHQREFFARMDAIVCVTPQNVDIFRGEFPESAAKAVCLPNLNPFGEILRQASEFVPYEYQENTFNVFTAARLSKEKAIDWIIEAASILKEKKLAFRWYIAGADADLPARELAAAARVEDVVIFTGLLVNPYPYIKHCDLYAQPSRYEGKPIAVTEAMILGRTVLLTRYTSAAESVTDGVDGMICDMNPEAIASAVLRLAHDKTLRDRLATGISIKDDTCNVLPQYEHLLEGEI